MVLRDIDTARMVHLTEHVDAHVDIFNRDNRVAHQLARDESALNVVSHFAPRLSAHGDSPEHREINRPLFVDGIGHHLTRARSARRGRRLRFHAGSQRGSRIRCREGELAFEHRIGTVHDDVHLVLRPQAQLLLSLQSHAAELRRILEIGHVIRRGTGGRPQADGAE